MQFPYLFSGYCILKSQELGERIRAAREGLNITQEELAERVRKDQRAISEYENGRRRLSAIDMPLFAKALNVSILYFFEGELSKSDLDAELLQQFNELPTTDAKQAAIELLRVYLKVIIKHYSS